MGKFSKKPQQNIKKHVWKSKTVNNNLNPVWNEEILFENLQFDDYCEIRLEVYDNDFMKEDDKLGEAFFVIGNENEKNEMCLDLVGLGSVTGNKIHFSYETKVIDQKIQSPSSSSPKIMYRGKEYAVADNIVEKMCNEGRMGRKSLKGFYVYNDKGKRSDFWDGLKLHWRVSKSQPENHIFTLS